LLEERIVGHGAGRDHAHHLAVDRALRFGRVADLLAQRNRLALAHEARQVGVDAVIRHARHGDRFAARLAARGQRDVEEPGGAPRVVVEQLVEVAHAIEKEGARVLGLDAQVLLHHRSVLTQ
jgi:hypothetical protein